MNDNAADTFRVAEQDDHGDPVRCSYCPRDVKRVVVLPLSDPPERILAANDDERWLGLCAHCVLKMARALARAEGLSP